MSSCQSCYASFFKFFFNFWKLILQTLWHVVNSLTWKYFSVTSLGFARTSEGENRLYVRGTLLLHFTPWALSTQLFWKTLTDVCWIMQRNHNVLFQDFCFTSQATNSKSFFPAANSWFYAVTVFCLFVRCETQQLADFKKATTELMENSF